MEREKVYHAIDTERDFQERKWGTIRAHGHEVGAYLTIMRNLLVDADRAWAANNNDYDAMEEIRKMVAVGVACCEQHGVQTRSKFWEPPVRSMRESSA